MRKRKQAVILHTLSALLLFFLCSFASIADERILYFESEITAAADGSASVVDTITVRAEGGAIQRGIYRDIITSRGQRVSLDRATRDGQPDGTRTERISDGVRLYVGRADYRLPHGEYTYEISYRVTNVVKSFEDHDQLYWNITGNGWAFPIDSAVATVAFDADVPLEELKADGYTGRRGERGKAFTISSEGDGAIRIETTQPLPAYNGLTVVMGIPTGYFELPTGFEWFSFDAGAWNVAAIAASVPIVYFCLVWIFVGRDPLRRRVKTLFDPPKDLSPAAARFLTNRGYDSTAFASAIVHMASLGHYTIKRKDERYTIVYKDGDRSRLFRDEKVLSRSLGLSKGESIATTPSKALHIVNAAQDHAAYLADEFRGTHFSLNRSWWIAGCALSLIAVVAAVAFRERAESGGVAFLGVMLLVAAGFAMHGAALVMEGARGRIAYGSNYLHVKSAVIMGLFYMIGGGVATIVLSIVLGVLMYWHIAILAVLLGVVCWLFFVLMPAPSRIGRDALDRIEAFKRGLSGAGSSLTNRVSAAHAPAYFDERFAYALALGAAEDWAQQFTDAFPSEEDCERFRPRWYRDPDWSHEGYHLLNFCRSGGTGLAGAVGTMSPPSSTGGAGVGTGGYSGFGGGGFSGGGFGGGGFSGGGFGGGGGGGW